MHSTHTNTKLMLKNHRLCKFLIPVIKTISSNNLTVITKAYWNIFQLFHKIILESWYRNNLKVPSLGLIFCKSATYSDGI